jgi:probable rRNA maturation factor
MSCVVHRQVALAANDVPRLSQLRRWAAATIASRLVESCSLTVRFVGDEEGAQLNERFRGSAGATNVLSFPADPDLPGRSRYIGDLVLTVPRVESEARAIGRSTEAHYAHLVVHGVLHLLGYDHQDDEQACVMEDAEREILRQLGYSDPYSA